MTSSLIIPEGEDTPKVTLDKTNNFFEISGRSFPEDASIFYRPIIEWFDNYCKEPNNSTELIFKFEYYNSASARQLLKLLKVLQTKITPPNTIKIIWDYDASDEQMKFNGEELKTIVKIPFELKSI